eukprot:scaffold16697_cov23-Tisochrysis_lutea.AAC.1
MELCVGEASGYGGGGAELGAVRNGGQSLETPKNFVHDGDKSGHMELDVGEAKHRQICCKHSGNCAWGLGRLRYNFFRCMPSASRRAGVVWVRWSVDFKGQCSPPGGMIASATSFDVAGEGHH